MKIKQTIVATLIIFAFLLPIFATPNVAHALKCGGVETSLVQCGDPDPSKTGAEGTGLWQLLITALNILTAGVGVAAVGGIVYGGILYTTSRGKPEARKKAIITITNVVVGLVMYALMFAFLNFIIPGGIFT